LFSMANISNKAENDDTLEKRKKKSI